MAYPVYYIEENDTLVHLFDSFDGGTGASITLTGLAVTDIEVYKDGSTTQRASDNGFTLLDTDGIDFDGITGIHGFSIDLSDNTTAGFYAVGPWYHVVVSSVTIDAQTVNFVACAFRIVSATRGMAGTALPNAAADAAGGLIISDTGGLDADAQLVTKINDILTDTGTTLQSELDGIQADTEDIQSRLPAALVGGRIDATVDGTGLESGAAAVIADAVWDEDATGHQTGGTFGQAIGDPGANTETMYDAVVTDAAGANVAADIIAVKAETASILTDTAEIGAAGAGLTEAGGDGDHLTAINLPDQTMNITGNVTGNVSGSVGSVTGNVGGNVTGSVGSLAAQAKADVNAEVLDVLNTDTFAEPGQGSPAATTSLVAKIGYLYKAWRNKSTTTASEYALYADDATTKDQEAALSDDGTTATKGEVSTGA